MIKHVILTDPGCLHIAINSCQSFDHVARVPLLPLPIKIRKHNSTYHPFSILNKVLLHSV